MHTYMYIYMFTYVYTYILLYTYIYIVNGIPRWGLGAAASEACSLHSGIPLGISFYGKGFLP